ncbi:MAG: protease modulator HflC [bacterium]|nr:MAG: protease modulator HflC [bacterium]
MKLSFKTSTIFILIAVLLVTITSAFYILEEGKQAIIVQFGRPVGDTITEAGLHFKLPFIQVVRLFEKRLLVWDGDPNQIPTKGREFIWVDTTARWRIADAKKFLENVATETGAQSRLDDIIDSVVRDEVSNSELVELVRSTSWVIPEDQALEAVPREREEELKREIARGREEITRTILTEAQKIIPQYGIELVDVRIKRLDYVESVRQKVYERMISERKRIAAQFRSEGEGRSAEILGEMERELRQIRSMAYRKVQEIRGRGDAEATLIYGRAYNRDPEFYAFLRTLESYREGAHGNSMLVLTTDSDFYKYMKDATPE